MRWNNNKEIEPANQYWNTVQTADRLQKMLTLLWWLDLVGTDTYFEVRIKPRFGNMINYR